MARQLTPLRPLKLVRPKKPEVPPGLACALPLEVDETLHFGSLPEQFTVATCNGDPYVLKPASAKDAINEAKILQHLGAMDSEKAHPHIVRFFGLLPHTENHLNFDLVVELGLSDVKSFRSQQLVQCPSSEAYTEAKQRELLVFAATVAKQTASALAHCHRHDVHHCDIKPENILITTQQPPYFVKLIDWGSAICKPLGVTKARQKTSLGYIDPDFAESGEISHRTEAYSFALTIWAIIMGRPAFDDNPDMTVIGSIDHRPRVPPLDDIPAPLRPLLQALLSKSSLDGVHCRLSAADEPPPAVEQNRRPSCSRAPPLGDPGELQSGSHLHSRGASSPPPSSSHHDGLSDQQPDQNGIAEPLLFDIIHERLAELCSQLQQCSSGSELPSVPPAAADPE